MIRARSRQKAVDQMQKLPLTFEVLNLLLIKNSCRSLADYIRSAKFEFILTKTKKQMHFRMLLCSPATYNKQYFILFENKSFCIWGRSDFTDLTHNNRATSKVISRSYKFQLFFVTYIRQGVRKVNHLFPNSNMNVLSKRIKKENN